MLPARPASFSNEVRRAAYDALEDRFPLAPDVKAEPVDACGVAAEWTSTPGASTGDVILYLHGGGYAWGSLKSHRHLASELGRAATMRTLALDYRRAPESPFPQALDDALIGYRFLLDAGFDARRIALAGDSAGAGLAVALLVRLKEQGLSQPAGALLMSPWVDLTASADSYHRNAKRDPVRQRCDPQAAAIVQEAADAVPLLPSAGAIYVVQGLVDTPKRKDLQATASARVAQRKWHWDAISSTLQMFDP